METINREFYPISWRSRRQLTTTVLAYKAVFFDLDGTIMETIPHICDSYNQAFRHFGLPERSDEALMKEIGRPLVEVIRDEVPEPFREAFLSCFRHYNEQKMLEKTGIFWPAWQLMSALQKLGVPMGLITAKGRRAVDLNLETCGLKGFFQVVLTADDSHEHKPEPGPLWLAKSKLEDCTGNKLENKDCLYIGDAKVDVAAARNAGFGAGLVAWTHMPLEPIRAEGDYLVVQSIEDLCIN